MMGQALATLAGEKTDHAKLCDRLAAANEILSSAPWPEPAVAVGRALLLLTEAPRAAVFFRSPDGAVTCQWFHNLSDAYIRTLGTPRGSNPWLHIMRHPELQCLDLPKKRGSTPEPSVVRDIHEWPLATGSLLDQMEREGFRSVCAWPVSRAGRVIAALAIYFDEPCTALVVEHGVMEIFAQHIVAFLDNHNQVERELLGLRHLPGL